MRDDTARWAAPGVLQFQSATLQVAEATVPGQFIISGPDVLHRFAKQRVGWPDPAPDGDYALALRRDRILYVGQPPLTPGYHDKEGLAVSDASDAYAVMTLRGPTAFDALRRGTEIRLDQPSHSVLRTIFGVTCCLYRPAKADGFMLHAPRAQAGAVLARLTAKL